MDREQEPAQNGDDNHGNLLALALLALFVGAVVGLLGTIFRLALQRADSLRDTFIAWAHGGALGGFLFVIAVCAAATAVAAWLVRRYSPHASGSGIPHVELVLSGELPPAPYRLIPVKFFGGLLAIGSGLALGREGPSVQMGASVADLLARLFHCEEEDCRACLAAGAGAGLATAFNAPIAGGVFVLEELVRRFDTRIAIATFGASAGAIAVARLFLGSTPDFHVEELPYPSFGTVPIHLLLGIIAGLVGVAYNRTLLGTLASLDKLRRCPVELRAALVGAAVGTLAWFAPGLVGWGRPDHAVHSFRHGHNCCNIRGFPDPVRLGSGILFSINAGWIVRTYACIGGSARLSLWIGLLLLVPRGGSEPYRTCCCRYGGILHRRRESSDDRYRPDHRDDL